MIHFDPKRVHSIVPNLLGAYLPRSDVDDTEFHSCTMLTFFVPWRSGLELKLSTQTWTEAYHAHSFSAKHDTIIKNMNIRYECYDTHNDFHAQLKARAQAMREEGADEVDDAAAEEVEWDYDMSGMNLVDECQIGGWTRGKAAQMREMECVLESAGWKTGDILHDNVTIDGFQPERSLPMSKWRDIVTTEKKKVIAGRLTSVSSGGNSQDADLDLHSRIVNDARVVPGSYLFADFKTQDYDMVALMTSVVETFSLNQEQERAFRIVANHSMCVSPEPLRMYLGGMGGTGKTRVIDALQDWFSQRGESHRMVVLAPTGAAASIINGSTYHSFLGVNTGKHKYLSEYRSNSLQEARLRMMGVEYIFLDELSMVSCQNFHRIDRRLKDIKQVHDIPFGGVSMIVAGDFAQLPPAGRGKALYSGTVSKGQVARQIPEDQEESLGLLLWHQFVTVVILKQNMRQTEQGADDHKLREALGRMRYKSCTLDDLEFLRTLIPAHNPSIDVNDPQWRNVSIITAWNCQKDQINEMSSRRFATERDSPLHLFYSLDKQSPNFAQQVKKARGSSRRAPFSNNQRPVRLTEEVQQALWNSQPHSSEHIPACLALSIGIPVMIRYNQATELGITKGQEAVVKGWVSRQIPNSGGRMCLETLFVELSNPRRAVHLPYLPKNVVPLTRESTSITAVLPNDAEINITRQQIPVLLNFAMTDYTSQGKTRPVNIVDMMNCKNHQAMYTCLSRGKSAKQTLILRDFKESKITGGLDGWLRQEFRDLDTLSDITHLQYAGKLPPGIVQRLRTSTLKLFRQVYGSNYDMERSLQESAVNYPGSTVVLRQAREDAISHTQVSRREAAVDTRQQLQGRSFNPQLSSASSSVAPKRKTVSAEERASKRPRPDAPEFPQLPYSWTWDNINWSCAFDSYLTVLYHIMLRDVEQWTITFNEQGQLMNEVVQAFDSMRKKQCSKIGARERIRHMFWNLEDECFPRGPYGSDIFALAQMLQGVRIDRAVVDRTRTCSVCGHHCQGELFEAIGSYTMLRRADPPHPSISASLVALETTTAGFCAQCHGPLYRDNIYPSLLCVQMPSDAVPLRQGSRPMLIDSRITLREKTYMLAGVVYWSGIDAHFESRIVTSDGLVYRYDGMKWDGMLKPDGMVSERPRNSSLSNLDHRDAILAMYVESIQSNVLRD
jgi:hypothetical protein